MRRPGDEIGVQSIHGGLIQRVHRFIDLREDLFGYVEYLFMVGFEVLRFLARNFRLAETLLGKHDRERAQVTLATAGERYQRRGIEAAREEHAKRNVGDQVVADGFFQQRPQLEETV